MRSTTRMRSAFLLHLEALASLVLSSSTARIFCKQRPGGKQLEPSLCISLAFAKKTLWLPVVVEGVVDKTWVCRQSGTTMLVPLKALEVAPSRISGTGALKSVTDCYLAFQVGQRALVAHAVPIAVFILAHLLLTWRHGLLRCFHVWER